MIVRSMLRAALAAAVLVLAIPAFAAWPERSVQYVIPFAPGGESDVVARLQALVFKAKYGQDMVVVNKPGAGGGLAWSQMNNMPGDGYTIVGVNLPHIVLQPLEGTANFKTEDMTPVLLLPLHAGRRSSCRPTARTRRSTTSSRRRAKSPNIDHLRGLGHQLGEPRRAGALRSRVQGQDDLRAVQGHRRPGVVGPRRARVGRDVVLDARDPAEGQDAHAGGGDREAPAAVPGRADVPRARRQLGGRRVSRHRRAEVDAARAAQAGLGHDGRDQQGSRSCASRCSSAASR